MFHNETTNQEKNLRTYIYGIMACEMMERYARKAIYVANNSCALDDPQSILHFSVIDAFRILSVRSSKYSNFALTKFAWQKFNA